MAKIVPQGSSTVNLNLKDPFQSLVEQVDLVMKVGNYAQKASDRRQLNNQNSQATLMDSLTKGAPYLNADDYARLGSEVSTVVNEANNFGPASIASANMLQNVYEAQSESSAKYDKDLNAFNNIFSKEDIFNPDNYTILDENPTSPTFGQKITNYKFLETINDLDADWYNDRITEFTQLESNLFVMDKNGQLTPKKINKDSQASLQLFKKNKNIFYNIHNSRMDGTNNPEMSEMEFNYMVQSGGLVGADMENYRGVVTVESKERIKDLEGRIVKSDASIQYLQKNKNAKLNLALGKLAKDDSVHDVIMEHINENPELGDFTQEEIESGSYTIINPEGKEEVHSIPDEIARVYDKMMKEVEGTKTQNQKLLDSELKRYNFWSKIPFNADNKEPYTIKTAVKVKGEEEQQARIDKLKIQAGEQAEESERLRVLKKEQAEELEKIELQNRLQNPTDDYSGESKELDFSSQLGESVEERTYNNEELDLLGDKYLIDYSINELENQANNMKSRISKVASNEKKYKIFFETKKVMMNKVNKVKNSGKNEYEKMHLSIAALEHPKNIKQIDTLNRELLTVSNMINNKILNSKDKFIAAKVKEDAKVFIKRVKNIDNIINKLVAFGAEDSNNGIFDKSARRRRYKEALNNFDSNKEFGTNSDFDKVTQQKLDNLNSFLKQEERNQKDMANLISQLKQDIVNTVIDVKKLFRNEKTYDTSNIVVNSAHILKILKSSLKDK